MARSCFLTCWPGTFDLTVTMQGFKSYEEKGIALGATDRVRLRPIALDVGGMTETITVQSESVQVQTTNGARSGLITRDTMDDIALKGRDPAGLLKLLPGVIDTRNREAPGWESMNNLSINGRTSFNFSYDGVTNKDTGRTAPTTRRRRSIRSPRSGCRRRTSRPSTAAAPARRLPSSPAAAARTSVAARRSTSATTTGTATSTAAAPCAIRARPRSATPPLYTFDNAAWTIGGPVLIPTTNFNSGRNKLFFFFSQDILKRTDPGNLNQRRMPTALERQGDFSQTRDNQGRLVFIRDPLLSGNCAATTGGPACFPGNVIPANRIDAERAAAPEPVPAAERGRSHRHQSVQLRVPDDAGLAA